MKVPTIDSKLAKSLMAHDLDNLVYEKRQRKTVQPIITPPPIYKHKIQKTKLAQRPKQHVKNKQKQEAQSNFEKTVRNKLGRPKKIIRKDTIVRTVNNKKGQNQDNNGKIAKNQIEKSVNQKYQQKKVKKQDQKQVQKQIKSKFSKNKDIHENQDDQEDEKEEIIIKQVKKKGRPKKIYQQSVQNIGNTQNIPIINELKKINENENKRQIQIQKLQEQFGSTRTRRAKINTIKRYTENQIFQNFQEENQKYYPQYKLNKKKKNYAKKDPYYNINRIFRKQPKIELKPIQIMANLQIASLNFFVQKFGQFDLVHSSLPISILLSMNQIPNLIKKGFMLIWVQRGQTPIGYHLMNRWGFDVIDQIIWIKCDQQTRNMIYQPNETNTGDFVTNQTMFLNCKSSCLVGYKCPSGQKAEYRTKISNNIIFARPKLDPIQKPDEIFEIADLLVPGSKKLQLGGPPQNGWLSLNHQQNKLFRCWSCLKDLQKVKQLKIINSQYIPFGAFCNQCQNLLKERKQENSSVQKNKVQQNKIILVNSIQYIQSESQCNGCLKYKTQLVRCKTCKNENLCEECLEDQFKKHVNHQVSVVYKKMEKYNQIKLKCSECSKNTLVDFYYECQNYVCKSKSHIMCQQCFWSNSQQIQLLDAARNQNKMIEQKDQKEKRSTKKQSNIHQWKIKKIVCYPQLKNQCFSCKIELKLPYYCCQNCLGWTWCGKCKVVNNEIHPHSQKHNLFLMI